MLIDRRDDLEFLNALLANAQAGQAQLALVYGRLRVGKTALLLHWAENSGLPFVYWEAVQETAGMQRARFLGKLAPPLARGPEASWQAFWDSTAPSLSGKRILIIDELPNAMAADPAMLPALRAAWDTYLHKMNLIVILCGSDVRMMPALLSGGSVLTGCINASRHVQPLPFAALAGLFPQWDVDARISAYAMVGGVPAYLSWLNPHLDLLSNIQQIVLEPGSMFLVEPLFHLYGAVREPGSYLAILKAIGSGARTIADISRTASIAVTSATFYLGVLQELELVERRLSVVLDEAKPARRDAHH